MSYVYLQEAGTHKRTGTVIGLILVGAGGALGAYYILRLWQPKSRIVSVDATTTSGITATVQNVGKRAGEFKLGALVLKAGCAQPPQQQSYYGGGDYDRLKASGCLLFEIPRPEDPWTSIPPGGSAPLTARFVTGWQPKSGERYDVYLYAAVRTAPGKRLWKNEHYVWLANREFR